MTHWSLLGIHPTRDKSAIRRAYARQLKRMGAERDADSFHRLRTAREAALEEVDSPPTTQRPPVKLPQLEDDGATREIDTGADVAGPREEQTGPRLKIVETQLLDDEIGRGALFDDGQDFDLVVEDLRTQVTAYLSRLPDDADAVAALFRPLLASIADLPRGPRRDVEMYCLAQIASRLRTAEGAFDTRSALRVRPFALACDDAFGWSFDDDIVHVSMEPRDAETLMLMLDSRDGSASWERRSLPARLRRFDAQVLLEGTPRLLSIYKAVVAGGKMPWRFHIWAALAPHLWALYRRYWAIAAAWYLTGVGIAFVALLARPGDHGLIALSGATTCCLCIASGYLADRTVFLYAWRAVRSADRRGLYDPTARKEFLRSRDRKINLGILFYFTLISAWVSMLPYVGIARWFGLFH